MMACGHGGRSTRLGWDYNDPKYGGFQSILDYEQECPPNMVLLDGGEWCSEENDTLYSYDIRSFFISKHEETNG
ncbi:MAG: sulfatase modifying factor 1, partial [Arenicella sp.]